MTFIAFNGQKIAMLQPSKAAIHLHGVQTQGAYGACGTPWYFTGQSSLAPPFMVSDGDVLSYDQKADAALSGVWLGFGPGTYGDGSYSANLTDAPDGTWHHDKSTWSP